MTLAAQKKKRDKRGRKGPNRGAGKARVCVVWGGGIAIDSRGGSEKIQMTVPKTWGQRWRDTGRRMRQNPK